MATSLQVTGTQSCKCTPCKPGSLPKNIYNAAKEGTISEITEWLNTPTPDVNSASQLNRTILHFACMEDHTKMIEVMMTKNVCLNTRDSAGETPLMIASKNGHNTCVELLLKSKSSNHGGGCSVDVDALTKYNEKTALDLAQEELERAEKENNFQDIVYMLRKGANICASTNSIKQTRNNVNEEEEEPLMVEHSKNRVPETENNSKSMKSSLVTKLRDGVQGRSTSVWNESKLLCKQTKSLIPLLLDLSPWLIQLLIIMITLYIVTGYRSSVGFVVSCNTNHSINVTSSIAYPLRLDSVQQVASGCDNSNRIINLKGDVSFELYLVVVVASITIATLVCIIVFHSNRKCEGMNILYVDLPVLFFNSYLWLCASCDLVLIVTKLKEVLDFDMIRNHNDHLCANNPSCIIKDFVMKDPYPVPLDVGCYLGIVIFFFNILHLFTLYCISFLSRPKETEV